MDPEFPGCPLEPLTPGNPRNPFDPFNPSNPRSPGYPLGPFRPGRPLGPSAPGNPAKKDRALSWTVQSFFKFVIRSLSYPYFQLIIISTYFPICEKHKLRFPSMQFYA